MSETEAEKVVEKKIVCVFLKIIVLNKKKSIVIVCRLYIVTNGI